MQAGADDYIIKPFNPVARQVRLNVGKRIVELRSELIAARETMRFQTTRDMLTTVWNRNSILELWQGELQRTRHNAQPLGVAMLDIDHFKAVNDTYGHPAGDLVIRECTHRTQAALRRYDQVGRYGGEEFLVILADTSPQKLPLIAERIRHSIGATPFNIAGQMITLTISIGVVATLDFTIRPDALINQTDEALYRAKNGGRNCADSCECRAGGISAQAGRAYR